ncbi:hypothetical protein GQ53DRAFT_769395 [Thozetella sp. PMI_491]|nr:hypothetical protein GQ53DRAFT_769395 [Thozetella sp. PMI_491]
MERSSRQFDELSDKLTSLGLETGTGTDLDELNRVEASDEKPCFLSMLDIATEYRIPYARLRRIGILDAERDRSKKLEARYGYSVGAGYSGRVVQHLTEEDIGDTRKGTVVALKQFTPSAPNFGKTLQDMETQMYFAARRELKALCHPRLRSCEYICDVLYMGWHADSPYPLVALELAAYGTLEDVLCAPGMGPSWLQKLNITIDIIAAMNAIHSCAMLHGDIKPSNIIIQRHSNRQLVAKMIDLAGSNDLFDDIDTVFRPGMRTELWSAPEVCMGSQLIDWYAADMYSLGLVIASIWSRPPTWRSQKQSGSCILERFIPNVLNQSERQNRLVILKTQTDLHPESVMQRSWSRESFINPILLITLLVDPAQRQSSARVAQLVMPTLCYRASRNVPLLSGDFGYRGTRGSTMFKVWQENYVESGPATHSLVYKQLLEDAQPAYKLLHTPIHPYLALSAQDIPQRIIEYAVEAMEMLYAAAGKFLGEDAFRLGRLAFHVAISQCLELGAPCDESLLTKSLYVSSLAGYDNAVLQTPLLGTSSSPQIPLYKLRPLFLVVGSILGIKSSQQALKADHPDLYASMMQDLRVRRRIHRSLSSDPGVMQRLRDIASCPEENPETFSLIEALQSYNVARTRQLLESDDCDASVVDDENRGVFHLLTNFEDEDAASLAGLCHLRGGLLNYQSQAYPSSCLMLSSDPSGTTLGWAWACGMKKYFSRLLELHKNNSAEILDYRLLVIHSAASHTPVLLQLLVSDGYAASHKNRSNFSLDTIAIMARYKRAFGSEEDLRMGMQQMLDQPWSDFMSLCLYACLWHCGAGSLSMVSRRVRHRSAALQRRLDTLQLLLQEGASVVAALSHAVSMDDAASLEVVCKRIKQSGKTDEHLLRLYYELLNTIFVSRDRSYPSKCFEVLLSAFPELAKQTCSESIAITPLCAAARNKNPRYAQRLLELDADIDGEYAGFSPLARALMDGFLETAEVIYQHMNEQQRQGVFEQHPVSGFTMTGRLVSVWLRERDLNILDALDWLNEKHGVRFLGYASQGEAAWTLLLVEPPPPVPEHNRRDAKLFEKLFTLFPDRLLETDDLGLMPIHRAAAHGRLNVLQILVRMGVDINTEIPSTASPEGAGRTALNLAISRLHSKVPKKVAAGGASVIARWRQGYVEMVAYLRSQNARSGSGASSREQFNAIDTSFMSDKVTLHPHEYGIQEEYNKARRQEVDWNGKWPALLGPDRSSFLPHEIEHSQLWMHVWCEETRKEAVPRGGVPTRPPNAYGEWLHKTASLRREIWHHTDQPSDEICGPLDDELQADNHYASSTTITLYDEKRHGAKALNQCLETAKKMHSQPGRGLSLELLAFPKGYSEWSGPDEPIECNLGELCGAGSEQDRIFGRPFRSAAVGTMEAGWDRPSKQASAPAARSLDAAERLEQQRFFDAFLRRSRQPDANQQDEGGYWLPKNLFESAVPLGFDHPYLIHMAIGLGATDQASKGTNPHLKTVIHDYTARSIAGQLVALQSPVDASNFDALFVSAHLTASQMILSRLILPQEAVSLNNLADWLLSWRRRVPHTRFLVDAPQNFVKCDPRYTVYF